MPKKEFKGNRKTYGKGSNRRPENFKQLRANWDDINWHNKWCAMCGKWTNHTIGTCPKHS
jgi:hypothetical protein